MDIVGVQEQKERTPVVLSQPCERFRQSLFESPTYIIIGVKPLTEPEFASYPSRIRKTRSCVTSLLELFCESDPLLLQHTIVAVVDRMGARKQ